ncbi:MAG: hypothetical protein DRJ05_05365 [Bacteroidetes bacterium]|nr:MAG: hypothetical protein DRJ05_05365 [Bacteroidota bacterium]
MMTKLKDFQSFFTHITDATILIDGTAYRISYAQSKFPDHVLPQNHIDDLKERSIMNFFSIVEGIASEVELKEYVYNLTTDKPKSDKRAENVQYLLNLIEKFDYKILEDKRIIITKWAKKYIDPNNDQIIKDHTTNSESKKKEKVDKQLDNQGMAFLIHFKVQQGDIESDEIGNNGIKIIKLANYKKHCLKSYDEYRKIINRKVLPRRIKECCDDIIKKDGINDSIKNQARAFLSQNTPVAPR